MSNFSIFTKTLPFVLARFAAMIGLTVAMTAVSAIALWVVAKIGSKGGELSIIFVVITIAVIFGVYRFIKHYLDYMIKAAQIAVVTELVQNGNIVSGESMIQYGKAKVKERFIAANAFFVVDKLIAGSVRQIQKAIGKIGEFLNVIPGMSFVVTVINLFVNVVLNYVDEAIFAYIFSREGENAWKGAADGIVLYAQNWKVIIKNAVSIVILLLVFYVTGFIIFFGMFSALFSIFNTSSSVLLIAVILTYLFLASIKESFLDSYITISVINKFINTAADQKLSIDLYEKARQWSSDFRKILSKGDDSVANTNTI